MSIELTDGDKQLLRACPFEIIVGPTRHRTSQLNVDKMEAVTRMQRAGLVSVTVKSRTLMLVILRDPGRIAIGLPPIETTAEKAV